MIEFALVVPTYNEKPNIAALVDRLEKALAGIQWEIIFVDDDSPDGTSQAVRDLALRMPRVRCLQRIGRRGLSRAVIEGCLSTSAPFVAVMDADLQHDETLLPAMLRRLKANECDVVVGSRYVEGGSAAALASGRLALSQLANRMARAVIKTPLLDPMSGFFAFRRAVFDDAVRRLSGVGYKVLLDMLASSPRTLRVTEAPYTFRARHAGESKLDSAVVWEFIMLLIDKRLGRWLPARFLMFSLVGASGVAVHFAVLWLAYRGAGLPFDVSQGLATFTAMTTNFAFNDMLTYRDRRHRGWRWLQGLLSFYAVCGLGVLANLGVATALFERHEGWVVSAAAGALVGVLWNYLASSALTWRKPA
ncbi:MAG TPA: glycosyltransferase family 2 protein [Ramlibacter sp.]|nr:glycosyltransferase family 2 protein [Ramlibacter sp.]